MLIAGLFSWCPHPIDSGVVKPPAEPALGDPCFDANHHDLYRLHPLYVDGIGK